MITESLKPIYIPRGVGSSQNTAHRSLGGQYNLCESNNSQKDAGSSKNTFWFVLVDTTEPKKLSVMRGSPWAPDKKNS